MLEKILKSKLFFILIITSSISLYFPDRQVKTKSKIMKSVLKKNKNTITVKFMRFYHPKIS